MLKITPSIFIILITCSKISAQTNKIESTGNVGIGTLNPSSKLEVKSDASQGPLRIFGPNSYMLIDNVGSGESYYQANVAHRFQGSQGSEHFTILGNGNVGLSNPNPITKLDVAGLLHVMYPGILNYPNIGGTYVGWNRSAGGGEANFVNNIAGGSIGGFTFDKTADGLNFSRLFTILNNGRIGIGNSDPTSMLTVSGDLSILNGQNSFIYNGAADIILKYAERGTGGRALVHDDGNKLTLNYGGDFSGGTSIGSNTFFSTNNTGTSYVSAGNFAIGTKDTKGYKLAVAGGVIAESVTVKVENSWPDYVFQENYLSPSLHEVEKFIKANKHLPEIPSASEVSEKGISLGDINAKLLKKIEELTLYLIEKDKQMKNLEERLQQVEGKIR
jgi:hypothetical protein